MRYLLHLLRSCELCSGLSKAKLRMLSRFVVKAWLRQAKFHVGSASHAFGDRDHPLSRKVDPHHIISALLPPPLASQRGRKGLPRGTECRPLTPAEPPVEGDAGRRPAIQMQGIGVLGRHIAQASPVFGAKAREGSLWRHIGRASHETSPHGGMKPPAQPFAFAAGLHGSP